MSLLTDELERLIAQSVSDAEATRDDWLQALDRALPRTDDDVLDPAQVVLRYRADASSEVEQRLVHAARYGLFVDPDTERPLELLGARVVPVVPGVPDGFWPQIRHQLVRIADDETGTFDGVRAILLDPAYGEITAERNRNGVRRFGPDAAFFAGAGGSHAIRDALRAAGWTSIRSRTSYWYVVRHERTGEVLTYTEGDVERGDRIAEFEAKHGASA